MAMLKNSGTLQNTWISKGIHSFMASVWGGSEQVRDYFSLRKKNDELADINFRQQQLIRKYREITGVDFSADSVPESIGNFRYIPARIAKTSNNKQHNYLIIAKGSEDGVVPDSGVITENGVIGIIDAVGKHYSFARSFRNADMSVSARIGRQGALGSLSWNGYSSNGAILKDVPQHISIHQGDTVFTSGFSSFFPPDIPLGILGEYRVENGATYEIKVSLFEDFATLRYVTLVNNINVGEIAELENGE